MGLNGKKIVFLGAGNMAEAMIKGLESSGVASARQIIACDLLPERQEAARAMGVEVLSDAGQAAAMGDIVVLSVKPQAFDSLLPSIRGKIKPEAFVLSIAAGVTIGKIQAGLGPEVPVVRVMPNTPALIGQGASGYCLGPGASSLHAQETQLILESFGVCARVQEAEMDAVTALSGSGPAYVFLLMESLQAAGESMGLDKATTFKLAAQTLKGAAVMIGHGQVEPAELRRRVTSPAGTTAAAIEVFEQGGFRELVAKALTAARDRGRELGK